MNDFDHRTAIKQILLQLDFIKLEEKDRYAIQLGMMEALKEFIEKTDKESNNHFNHVLKAPLLRITGLCNVLCLLADNSISNEPEFKDIVKKMREESETLLTVLENYFGCETGISKKFKRKATDQ